MDTNITSHLHHLCVTIGARSSGSHGNQAAGVVILATLLGALFASALSAIPRWGATDEEIVLALPGDELAPQPLIHWTNAIDVNAPPADVWPWIAQLGDTRGGFYSYTFIQPDIWVRVLVNAALLFGVWWADHPATQSSPALRAQPFAR